MEKPLTPDELAEMERRAGGATPGPWEAGVRYERFGVNEGVRPGEGPFSFLPVGRCYCCAETGEPPLGIERDRHGCVYHVHRVGAGRPRPASGWRTISSAATRETVVESFEGMVSAGIRPRDAEFIAHARVDVPRLVAEVRRLRAALETMEELRRAADSVQRTMGALRQESEKLKAERNETLAAVRRSRDELRSAVERLPPARHAARPGSRGEN
jgi:cytochrome c556